MLKAEELLEKANKSKKSGTLYLISYDLRRPSKNYNAVERAILRIDKNAEKVLRSQWVVDVDDDEMELEDICTRLWRAMDSNDRLLVVGLDLVDGDARNLLPNTYLEHL